MVGRRVFFRDPWEGEHGWRVETGVKKRITITSTRGALVGGMFWEKNIYRGFSSKSFHFIFNPFFLASVHSPLRSLLETSRFYLSPNLPSLYQNEPIPSLCFLEHQPPPKAEKKPHQHPRGPTPFLFLSSSQKYPSICFPPFFFSGMEICPSPMPLRYKVVGPLFIIIGGDMWASLFFFPFLLFFFILFFSFQFVSFFLSSLLVFSFSCFIIEKLFLFSFSAYIHPSSSPISMDIPTLKHKS